jgi:hypothetical protein
VNVETKEQSKQWITSEVYCGTLENCVVPFRTERVECWGVVLFHDNAYTHTAVHIWALLEHFYWEFFDHHYSPDLALRDCHPFTYLKNWLWSQHFNNFEELMEGVKTWLSSQGTDFFETDMFQMISLCLHHCCVWTVKQILIIFVLCQYSYLA